MKVKVSDQFAWNDIQAVYIHLGPSGKMKGVLKEDAEVTIYGLVYGWNHKKGEITGIKLLVGVRVSGSVYKEKYLLIDFTDEIVNEINRVLGEMNES